MPEVRQPLAVGHYITFEYHLDGIASSLAEVPGGLDVLYEVARQRQPNEILPYKEFSSGQIPVV